MQGTRASGCRDPHEVVSAASSSFLDWNSSPFAKPLNADYTCSARNRMHGNAMLYSPAHAHFHVCLIAEEMLRRDLRVIAKLF